MNPERWQKVDEIFQAAASLPPQERSPFVNAACANDDALRREVESLLAAQSEARNFFSPPTQLSQAGQTAPMTAAGALGFDRAPNYPHETTASDDKPGGKWFLRWSLAGIAVVALMHLALLGLTFKYAGMNRVGVIVDMRGTALVIISVDPRSPAAGQLRENDEILAVNGDRRLLHLNFQPQMRRIPPGPTCQLLVRRGQQTLLIEVDSALYQSSGDNRRWRTSLYGFSRGAVFLAIALLIALTKRHDRFAKFGVTAFIFLGLFNLRLLLFPLPPLMEWESLFETVILVLVAGLIFIPVCYHLGSLFPPGARLPVSRFWLWLRYLLYAASAVLTMAVWLTALAPYSEALNSFLLQHEYLWFHFFRKFRGWYYPFGLACICAVLVRNFWIVRDADNRRRMKLMVYGNLVTIMPVAALALLDQTVRALRGTSRAWVDAYEAMVWVTDSTTIWIPVVWGYAILTQRVYPARVALRRGLQYLLARNALRVLLILPVLALVVRVLSKPDQSLRELLFAQPTAFVLVTLAALSLAFRKQLRGWLDRKFFREQVNQEQTLFQLIDEINDYDNLPDLCRGVSQRLEEALHPARGYFIFRRDRAEEQTSGQQPLAFSLGGEPLIISPAQEVALFELMKRQKTALQLPLPRGQRLSAEERAVLERLAVTLLVPIMDSEDQLVGILLLGEKKSEEPYSPTDRRLLLAVAQQMGTAIEVGHLRAQVRRKTKSERDTLARLDAAQINLLRECPQCGLCFDSSAQQCGDCGSDLVLPLPVERTIEERYRLERLLGKGGMGAVYAATDLRLRRAVAVKLIHADYFGDKLLRRFEKEAQTAASLSHSNIVKVFDYGRTQTGGVISGGAWLVMELVRGVTMREELNQLGRLSPELAADWFQQLLEGLKAAHQATIVHRDLKPENVLVSRNEEGQAHLRILDFGLAKLREAPNPAGDAGEGLTTLTKPGTIVGTLFYMSPEQLSGEVAGEPSDIFTIGVMVAEALTGRRPFDGRTPTDVLEAIWRRPFRFSGDSPELLALNRVVQRCLMVSPQHRYQTVAELQSELIPALRACAGMSGLEMKSAGNPKPMRPTQNYNRGDFKTGQSDE